MSGYLFWLFILAIYSDCGFFGVGDGEGDGDGAGASAGCCSEAGILDGSGESGDECRWMAFQAVPTRLNTRVIRPVAVSGVPL